MFRSSTHRRLWLSIHPQAILYLDRPPVGDFSRLSTLRRLCVQTIHPQATLVVHPQATLCLEHPPVVDFGCLSTVRRLCVQTVQPQATLVFLPPVGDFVFRSSTRRRLWSSIHPQVTLCLVHPPIGDFGCSVPFTECIISGENAFIQMVSSQENKLSLKQANDIKL